MVPVELHPEISHDVAEIQLYRAGLVGAQAAARYAKDLYEFIYGIGFYPNAGRTKHYAGVEVQVRTFLKRHQVVYLYEEGVVRVLEVHHSKMSGEAIERRVAGRL